jgi:hypothetical protein
MTFCIEPVILAKIGNRLVIGNQPTGEPHDLNVAAGLTFKPAARLNPIEITVDGELQKDRRTVRRPPVISGSTPPNLSSARSSPSTKSSIRLHEIQWRNTRDTAALLLLD